MIITTYSKRLDGREFLNNGFLLGEVGSSNSEGSGSDNGETDWDSDNEENQGVVKQIIRAGLCDRNVMEEAANPSSQNPEHDENEKSGTNVVHDSLEMALILCSLDQISCATDKGLFGSGSDNSESLSTLASSGVVGRVTDVLVDSQRLSSNGRLVDSNKSSTTVRLNGGLRVASGITSIFLLLFLFFVRFAARSELVLSLELLVQLKVFGGVIVADQLGISGDSITFLDENLLMLVLATQTTRVESN